MQLDPYQLLVSRLRRQRVNIDETPALLRGLSDLIESNPGSDSATMRSKFQPLGWNGVALGYQSLQLALAWIETAKP
jgi:hypothetical protein